MNELVNEMVAEDLNMNYDERLEDEIRFVKAKMQKRRTYLIKEKEYTLEEFMNDSEYIKLQNRLKILKGV